MFLAAIAHHYSFSHKPYIDGIVENKSLCAAFLAMWDVSDVHSDMKEHFGIVGKFITFWTVENHSFRCKYKTLM